MKQSTYQHHTTRTFGIIFILSSFYIFVRLIKCLKGCYFYSILKKHHNKSNKKNIFLWGMYINISVKSNLSTFPYTIHYLLVFLLKIYYSLFVWLFSKNPIRYVKSNYLWHRNCSLSITNLNDLNYFKLDVHVSQHALLSLFSEHDNSFRPWNDQKRK